jgi:catabolite repression HPr-like protein
MQQKLNYKEVLIMTTREIEIKFHDDADARTIAGIVRVVDQFKSSIYFEVGTKRVNAKSIIGMTNLLDCKGIKGKIMADGPDEKEAVEAIVAKMTC